MNRRTAVLLWDAARALGAAAEFTAGKTYDVYLANKMMRSAVERQKLAAQRGLTTHAPGRT